MVSRTGEDLDSFGAYLHACRKQRHLTQQQLAAVIGVHRHAIRRWEQGEVLPASKAIVLEIARHLHLSDQDAQYLIKVSMTAPQPLWGVPFSRNPFFTGREDTLETLHQHLGVQWSTMFSRSCALYGLGGVGKTQTVLEYAYRHILEYHAIFWIEAETNEHVLSSLQRIAELLKLPEQAETDQQRIIEAVHRWFATHDQWLLIWDGLEDMELPCRLLPLARLGTFLFTTRHQALGTLAYGIELHPLDHETSVLLLLRRAKIVEPEATDEYVQHLVSTIPAEYAAASSLATTLGGLPLALDQAGAYLEETGCSLLSYLHSYEQEQAFLLDRRGWSSTAHPQSVATTFALAIAQVEHEQQEAADVLRVCALLHADTIPEELFSTGAVFLGPTLEPLAADPFRIDQVLVVLRRLSLVQRQVQTRTFSLHRVVQAVMRTRMNEQERSIWLKRVSTALGAVFPQVSREPET